MKRQIRRKLIIQQLEKKLETYGRRIQKMAENAYKIRKFLETLNKQENDDAIHNGRSEGQTGDNPISENAGGIELLDNTPTEALLGEQPVELRND